MKKKILIVDDEKNIVSVIKELFLSKGYNVRTAFSGKEAIKHLKEEKKLDVILVDILMPGINGIEVLKEVKEKHKGIKTVILTGFLEEYKDEIEKIGCDAILTKPFSIKTLIEIVESVILKKKVEKEQLTRLIEDPKILGKARLLFIEPNEIMYSSKLGYFQNKKGCNGEYEFRGAYTGEQVVEKLNNFKPDIVLSNINMYMLYGIADKIANSKKPPKDIILYGLSKPQDLEKVKDTSFVDGLFDPITSAVTPKEMDKLAKIVRSTAIAHNLYIREK